MITYSELFRLDLACAPLDTVVKPPGENNTECIVDNPSSG